MTANQVLLDQKDRKASKDRQAHQGLRVLQVCKETPAMKAHQVLQDRKDRKDSKDRKVTQETTAMTAHQVL